MRKFQKKLTKKFFKNSKRNYFGPFWAFCLYLGKNEFSWKKGLSDFKYSNYLPRCKKSRNSWPIPDKYVELTNGQTDRQTNRQTDYGDFIRPYIGRGSCQSWGLGKFETSGGAFNIGGPKFFLLLPLLGKVPLERWSQN